MEEIFQNSSMVKMCAPMVRYSRLPFRLLVRKYDCDVAFTPMLMADSFVKSEKYRQVEFSTCEEDSPLIVQLAANNPTDFVNAAEIAYKRAIGVDLNCGCPQSWATHEGIGACLMNKPQLIADILRETRNRIPDANFSVSAKIRIFLNQTTVDLARQLEAAGITFLTVHGRTKSERAEPVHLDYIKVIAESLQIPVIANGDVNSLAKAHFVQEATGVKGVMSARGIVENPCLFAGYERTPPECISQWIEINNSLGSHYTMFHRHLIHMCSSILLRSERRVFNCIADKTELADFLSNKFSIQYTNVENIINPKINNNDQSTK